ncbi:hypothetical protein KCP70_16035 [Salmonella enterica subsp. enterica]|nr:hypothetical protein KCP70_16035 [Salmonella enterica subsp. enterica]
MQPIGTVRLPVVRSTKQSCTSCANLILAQINKLALIACLLSVGEKPRKAGFLCLLLPPFCSSNRWR